MIAPITQDPIPRASSLPIVGSLISILSRQLSYLEELHVHYGDIFQVDLGVEKVIVVACANAAEQILVDQARDFDKGDAFWNSLREAIGQGLSLSEGELWRQQRRLLQPTFLRSRVQAFKNTIVTTVEETLSGLRRDGRPVDVEVWADELLATLTVRLLFGSEIDRARTARVHSAIAELFDQALMGAVVFRLPGWMQVPFRRRLRKAKAVFEREVMTLLSERREQDDSGTDLLSTLLVANRAGKISIQQVCDEVMTLYTAGYETTGTTVAWTLWLLAKHRDACVEAQAELDSAGGSEDLAFLNACIHEGLRLYPPGFMIPRRAVATTRIGDFMIPAGRTVIVTPWLIHRNPNLWPRPEIFNPRRFLDGGLSSTRPRLAWCPFGAGQRSCIGKHLAMLELKHILAAVLRNFDPHVISSMQPRPRMSTTLRSRDGIFLEMRPREPSTRA